MKRFTHVLSILVVLSILLAACAQATEAPVAEEPVEEPMEEPAEEPAEEAEAPEIPTEFPRSETIYVAGAAWGPASTWNPFQTGSLANTTGTNGFVYEFLYNFDPQTGDLTPWLAESGEWTDDSTFVVTLRDSLTWSDGEALTAEDVAYSYTLGNEYAALWFSPMWEYMVSATATSDTVVEFKFNDEPLYQEFSNNLYNIPIVPKHLWEDRSEEDITVGVNENPVGSGAYLYLTNAEDRNIWVRNENWWGIDVFGTPAPKYIVDIRFSSNNIALGSVLKGELDLSNNFLPGVAELVNKGYVSSYFSGPPYMLSANTAVLFLNTTKAPMNDPAFRKALAYAIDVPSIVNTAYAQLVKAASPSGLLPALDKFVDQDIMAEKGYSFDTEKAKSMLAAAGYKDVDGDGFVEAPDGSAIALEVTCPNGWTDWMAAIDIIASSSQDAGINIQSAYPDQGAWNTALMGGTFDMTLNNWAAMSNTPWTLYNLLYRHPIQDQMQSGNFGRWENQEMFDLVDDLAKIPSDDIEGMQAACSAIQDLMMDEMPMIPLWYNGLWAQWSNAVWTNWPTEESTSPTLPATWNGYWQLGGLQTLINLTPAPTE